LAAPLAIVGVVAGIVLALAALAVRGFLLGYPRPALPARVLSAKEQAILAACADALFPPGGPIPLSGTEAGLVAYTDRYVARATRPTRALLRLLFHFVEHGPWIFGPRCARFTRLGADDRRTALDRMARSPIYFRRVAFLSLRTLLTMGYLANEEVLRAIGIPCGARPALGAGASDPPAEAGA
jgi:hypothetical protein